MDVGVDYIRFCDLTPSRLQIVCMSSVLSMDVGVDKTDDTQTIQTICRRYGVAV